MAAFALSGCSDNKTPSGFTYTKHISGGGAKANTGDYGIVQAYIFQNDSLVHSTREYGQTVPVKLPDFSTMSEEDKSPERRNPLEEAVAVMRVGDSVSVNVPINDAMRKSPQLAGVNTLRWDVVLVDVMTEEQYRHAQDSIQEAMAKKQQTTISRESEVAALVADYVGQYNSGALKDQIQTTPSGLKYLVIEQGTGAQITTGSTVNVQYYGALTNGTMFDNSFGRGQAFPVPVGQGRVIQGWDEGLALLKKGDKAFLFIPAELGYGAQAAGGIPPNSELIFYVEPE